MDTAIDELIDTADDLNVIGVVGLGDIVDDNNAAQYQTAKRIFYQLPKAGIKYPAPAGQSRRLGLVGQLFPDLRRWQRVGRAARQRLFDHL